MPEPFQPLSDPNEEIGDRIGRERAALNAMIMELRTALADAVDRADVLAARLERLTTLRAAERSAVDGDGDPC